MVVGFNFSGIVGVGGVGMVFVGWIIEGEFIMDFLGVDICCFVFYYNNKCFLRECVKEIFVWYYLLWYLYLERKVVCGFRCLLLFLELNVVGVLWSEKMGWEVFKWFVFLGEGNVILS